MAERDGSPGKRGFWEGPFSLALAGIFVGILAAGVQEVLFFYAYSTARFKAGEFLHSLLLYTFAWSLLGFSTGLLLRVLVRFQRGERPQEGEGLLGFSWLLVMAALLLVSYLFNRLNTFPPAFSPMGIAFNGLIVLLALFAEMGLFFLLSRFACAGRLCARGMRLGKSPLLKVLALAPSMGFGIFVLSKAVLGKGEPELHPLEGEPSRRPDVLLLVMETLRADHLSGYGYGRKTSPHLDKFLSEGVVFHRAYAQSNWTVPSVASLLSSFYPSSHRVLSAHHLLSGDVVTLAEVLKEAGYRTSAYSANILVDPQNGFDQGYDYFFPHQAPLWGYRNHTIFEKLWRRLSSGNFTSGFELNRRFLGWLSRSDPGKPFFGHLHYLEPHDPHTPPEPFGNLFDPDYKGSPISTYREVEEYEPTLFLRGKKRSLPQDAERRRKNMVARYDGEVAYLDAIIGDLFEGLQARDQYDEALIILTSDHGEEFFEHGGWWHCQTLYEELIHVPLAIKFPHSAGIPPEGIQRSVGLIDVMPTLLDFMGIQHPYPFQGRSLLSSAEEEKGERPVFSERPPFLFAVRKGPWKLIKIRDKEGDKEQYVFELYHVDKDPQEENNVQNAYPEVFRELKARLDQWEAENRTRSFREESTNIDSYKLEKLRVLGYVE